VPRDDSNRIQPVDFQAVAIEAAKEAPEEILVPVIPVDWYSNAARYRSSALDGVANWYAGFIGPNSEFIAMTQGFDVNTTWMQLMLESNKQTGEVVIQGQTWKIYESIRENNPRKSKDYMLVLEYRENALFVYGVAPVEQLEDFASQLTVLIETE
jgi:hypothetical protein